MTQREAIKVFEKRNIRSLWDDESEKWYFAIVDVVAALTDSSILARAEKATEG